MNVATSSKGADMTQHIPESFPRAKWSPVTITAAKLPPRDPNDDDDDDDDNDEDDDAEQEPAVVREPDEDE
jgi:hypothetical protein